MANENKRKKFIILAYAALVLSPLFLLLLESTSVGKNLFLSLPTWSDELDYFREVYSFSNCGFKFGGSLFAGYEALHGPFGAHSFSPIVVYGLLSLIFPFNAHSILYINLALLCLTWLLLILLLKPQGRSIGYLIVASLFFAPLSFYLYTSMLEIPLYAGLILFFALFKKYLNEKKDIYFYLALVLGILITFIRMTYVVVLFPLLFAKTEYKLNLKTLRNMVIYVVAFLACYKVYNLFCAGYPGWVTAKISEAVSIKDKLAVIFYNTRDNLVRFFSFKGFEPETMLRYAYAFTLLVLLQASFFERKDNKIKLKFDRFWFSLFFMSAGLWALMIVLYDIKDYRDFRTFAPILFFVFMFVFVTDKQGKYDKKQKWTGLIFILFIMFMQNPLLADREVGDVKEVTLPVFDENNGALSIGATMDINWGDASLMEALPPNLGFKVFYNNDIEYGIDYVDYVLTTKEFVSEHEALFEKLIYEADVEGYGVLYRK